MNWLYERLVGRPRVGEPKPLRPPHPYCSSCGGTIVLVWREHGFDRDTGEQRSAGLWQCSNDDPAHGPIGGHDRYPMGVVRPTREVGRGPVPGSGVGE